MKYQKDIILSSTWTVPGLYLAAGACMLFVPAFWLAIMENGIHWGLLPAILIFLFVIFFLWTQFILLCTAHISNNQLVLKKVWGSTKKYAPDSLITWEAGYMKRAKIITLTMKSDTEEETDIYMIIQQVGSKAVDVEVSLSAWKNQEAE